MKRRLLLMDEILSKIILITGEQGSGKSTFCRMIVDEYKLRDVKVSGILSELEKDKDKKLAINSINILTNEKKQLAGYAPGWNPAKPTSKWQFKKEIFQWGNHVLEKAIPTDLLIIDELGHMEFEERKGWNRSFDILHSKFYKCAVIVVRPEFIRDAKKELIINHILTIKNYNQLKEKLEEIKLLINPIVDFQC